MSQDQNHRKTRLVSPLGPRVLVKIIPPDSRNSAGLYLPANVEEKTSDALYGEIVAVARAPVDDPEELEGANVSGIPDGAHILFAPETGFRVPWDDSLRIVSAKHVLAVVEELRPEDAH